MINNYLTFSPNNNYNSQTSQTKSDYLMFDSMSHIFRYTVSKETGYVAEVSYEGTPVYPPAPEPKETQ